MLLTEEDRTGEEEATDFYKSQLATAYKYQPAAAILDEILQYYSQCIPEAQTDECPESRTAFYAVFSPLGRCGKTGFAMMLGQALAERGRALYLNFEEYPGFYQLFSREDSDFSELLLHLLQGREGLFHKLQKLVRPLGRMDYIPPGIGHIDFQRLTWEHWERLLMSIREEHVYDSVVLDLGTVPEVLFQIFDYCQEIYMPVLNDRISVAKLEEFQWICASQENGRYLKRMHKVMPPREEFWKFMSEEGLMKSALYRYARGVLEE